jgi:hypothetical protein
MQKRCAMWSLIPGGGCLHDIAHNFFGPGPLFGPNCKAPLVLITTLL